MAMNRFGPMFEAVDRLTTASNEFVRSRIVRTLGNKEKDTHKLPFDVHDLYRRATCSDDTWYDCGKA